MRTCSVLTAMSVAFLLTSFNTNAYVDCDDIIPSTADTVSFVNSSGDVGDIVWVPMNITNPQSVAAFIAYVRYDSTLLTPVEDPNLPGSIWAQAEGRLATSLYYKPDAFWVLPSQNPEDSGGFVVAFNSLSPELAPDLSPGSGTVCLIPFEINPSAPVGATGEIWFHAINQMYIIGVDTFFADCRRTEFAVGGGYESLWPTTQPATVTVVQTTVPEIVNCPATLVYDHCDPSSIQFDFDGYDLSGSSIYFTLLSGPGQIDSATGVWTYQPTAQDIGTTHTLEVQVCTPFSCSVPCSTDVTVTNDSPQFTNGCNTVLYVTCGQFAHHQVTATQNDCDPLWYELINVVPNPVGAITLDSATGEFTFFSDPVEDCFVSYTVTLAANDGLDSTDCQFAISMIGPEAAGVVIEKTHNTIQGSHETVDLTYVKGSETLGGFDFLIAYDASTLTFTGAIEGSVYEDCGWEYFTYRYGDVGNCDGCPSGLLRVVGIAEINNGPNHATCFSLSPGDTFATLDFLVSNDRTLECQYVPIKFFWIDCGDNAISSRTGDTLRVLWNLYDFEGNLIWNEDDNVNFPESNRIPHVGVPQECFNTDPSKPRAQSLVDFWNGGIDIVCADSIDARGDINLNEVPNEIADAVLFSNYFIYGIGVFTQNVAGQTAASDVNADGLTLTVADLVYLIRVITGDALAYSKLIPEEVNWRQSDGVISVDREIGAAYVVLEGNTTPSLLTNNMEMRYNFDGDNTRVIIYSFEAEDRMSGELIRTEARVLQIEMATYEGAPVTTKESTADWALRQNYPNPFNPVTTISFDLRNASEFSLEIFNISGQRVDQIGGYKTAGHHEIQWDASGLASGIYFYKLQAGDYKETKKMILLK